MTDSLGKRLRSARELLGLSLRDVERNTSQELRSGYLSQLERDLIQTPTPATLSKLADLYGLDYADLLELAGHRLPEQTAPRRRPSLIAGIPVKALDSLDDEARDELRNFVEYLVHRQKRQPGQSER